MIADKTVPGGAFNSYFEASGYETKKVALYIYTSFTMEICKMLCLEYELSALNFNGYTQ